MFETMSMSLMPTTMSLSHVAMAMLTVVLLVSWMSRKKKANLPPGPKRHMFLGNMEQLKGQSLFKVTSKWKEVFGPVFTIYLGRQPNVIIASIEMMTEAYIDKGDDFASKPRSTTLDIISDNGSDIAFAPFSEALKHRRRVVMQSLRTYLTGDQHTERINNIVTSAVDNMNNETGPFVITNHAFFISFNIIHTLCFGYTLPLDNEYFLKLHAIFTLASGNLAGFWEDLIPLLRYFPTKSYRELLANGDYFQNYLKKHIEQYKSGSGDAVMNSLVHNIFMAQKQFDEENNSTNLPNKAYFSDLVARQMLSNVFFAGTDTTRHTLEWVFLVFAAKPEIQNKVYKEIAAVVGDSIPNRSHRIGLPYTEATIMEAMRLWPSVPMGLAHETHRDTQLNGYDIPKGTGIMVNQYAIMRDPNHWDQPESFIPERFLQEDGTKLRLKPKSWIPFSFGQRNCIGEFLARQNILFTVIGVIQKVEISLAPNSEVDFEGQINWFSWPPKPCNVIVKNRK